MGKSSSGGYMRLDRFQEAVILALVFVIMATWIFVIGDRIAGADEPMRYDMAEWLYANPFRLPDGFDPELRNSTWGISYGFYPYFSYMIMAAAMHVTALFNDSALALLQTARMTSAVFIVIASFFTLRAGKKLFGRDWGTLFAVLVIFMPEFHYLGTYVNTDSLALMAAAIIFYAWAGVLESGWTWKNCITLAIGMGICMVSYYNAYGWVLFSFFFFVLTILLCEDSSVKERVRFLFSRGIPIAAVTLVICGWFFLHNAILYDGDLLGRNAATLSGEMYAKPGFKPSDHFTPQKGGWSARDLLIYQDPGWPHNWLIMSLLSFFGVFGIFDVYMSEAASKAFFIVTWVGILGMFLTLRSFEWRKRTVFSERQVTKEQDRTIIRTVRTVSRERKISREGIFHLMLLGTVITSIIIYIIYVYENDLQAQGRYFFSAVYGVIYFSVFGFRAILAKLKASLKVQKCFCMIFSLSWVLAAVLNLFLVILPEYA